MPGNDVRPLADGSTAAAAEMGKTRENLPASKDALTNRGRASDDFTCVPDPVGAPPLAAGAAPADDRCVTRGLLLLGAMAFVEGIPAGFAAISLPICLAAHGLTGAALGSLLALPLAALVAQPVLGAVVDHFGPRRPAALCAHVALALSFVGLAVADPPAQVATLFGGLLFLVGAAAALQQVAVDAVAVDRARPDDRGRVSGVLFGGRQLGTLIGGPALALWGVHIGWPSAFVLAALVCVLPLPFVARLHESPRARGGLRLVRTMLSALRAPGALPVLVFVLLAGGSSALLRPIVLPLFRDEVSLSMDRLTALDSIGLVTSTSAALLGGVLSDRWGRRPLLLIAGVLTVVVHIVFALARPVWSSFPALVAMTIAGDVANGLLQAGVFALLVDIVDPRVGATQLQLYMAAVRARTSVMTVVGGRLSVAASFGVGISTAVGIELAAVLLLLLVRPRSSVNA